MFFGKHVEAEMQTAAEKAKTNKAAKQKAQQVLNKYLSDGEQKFRDPMAAARPQE